MPRLVLLTEGFTGRSFEIKAERNSVGRLEDNSFQIPAPSVSGHHCEIIFKDNALTIKDLDSTNGCYINGEQISEAQLEMGQIVRFGAIEARLEETKGTQTGKKQLDKTSVLPQGVKLNELESGTQRIPLGSSTGFKKKTNKAKGIFITIGIIVVLGVVGTLVFLFVFAK